MLTETDVHLFHEGRLFEAHRSFGAHPDPRGGTRCTVWAPNARSVAVVSDANGWDADAGRLERVTTGVWTGTDRRLATGHRYKFRIVTAEGTTVDKADPFALGGEGAPGNASIVADLSHAWGDEAWMAARGPRQQLRAPMAIYEVHLGSWRRPGGEAPNYAAIAPDLAEHVVDLGFTHVELLPVMEHPFYGSWGYQTTGYFAPTARYGDPRDLMRMIDHLHQRGIGVILDWVPSHFPTDAFGLARFDGTPLFESEDQGLHPDWNTLQFDYARPEVRSFLVSSARHWLDRYHVDGIRVDAVASMLYLDYSRGPGEWRPNVHGGNENLDAIAFLRELNTEVYRAHPDVQTFAEESTAFPGVSRPVHAGGLGFGAKWDMGWMHDTLDYLARDPVHRGHHHGEVTFRTVYAWSEHFVLPLSHDEVVHGKGSLLTKMPGDRWQQLANLRMLLGMQYAQPGRKLLFMGTELAPETEWDHERALDWSDLGRTDHAGISAWLRDLNAAYRARPALYERDDDPGAFQWIEHDDAVESVFTFLRWDEAGTPMLVAINATPVVRHDHVVGVPAAGPWVELLNSDAETYGGSGVGNLGAATAGDAPAHGFAHSVALTLPPLAIVFLTPGPARPAASRPARP